MALESLASQLLKFQTESCLLHAIYVQQGRCSRREIFREALHNQYAHNQVSFIGHEANSSNESRVMNAFILLYANIDCL